ncbi:2-hydroxychromene-2-carboxylate isomerase [Emcibacter nanhaiensis]|nr:2-hydroxychromene-2-carboxylate isomerase [Emcibacter nanhaiensis]
MTTIDFYFDIHSPYAYLAFQRVPELARKHGCSVNYLPIDLRRTKTAVGNTGPAGIKIPAKARHLFTDLQRWADRYGVALGGRPKGMDSNRINRGVFFAQDRGVAEDYIREAYTATWVRGGDMASDELLTELAQKMGWDPDEFLAYIGSAEADERYEELFNNAIDRGVFGVPIYIIDDQMWWGNDRLQFVDEYLAGKK